MTIITWKFEASPEEIKIDDGNSRVVLSDGQISINIPQKKMIGYLNWIIAQEIKHGAL